MADRWRIVALFLLAIGGSAAERPRWVDAGGATDHGAWLVLTGTQQQPTAVRFWVGVSDRAYVTDYACARGRVTRITERVWVFPRRSDGSVIANDSRMRQVSAHTRSPTRDDHRFIAWLRSRWNDNSIDTTWYLECGF